MRGSSQLSSGSSQLSSARALLCMSTLNVISRRCTPEIVLEEKIFLSKFCKQGDNILDYSRYSQSIFINPFTVGFLRDIELI